jgi:HAD superfamily hydrolase (TIGR01549 family)
MCVAIADGQMKVHHINAVLMDVDGTLYYQPLLRAFMVSELIGHLIHPGSFSRFGLIVRVIKQFRRVREELRSNTSDHRSLEDWQYEITSERVGVSVEEVRAIVQEWIFSRPQKYLGICKRRGLVKAIGELRKAGIRVGAFSDYPVADKLRALGLQGHFSVQLSATDPKINAFKPNPKGFLYACDLWKLMPAQVVYIGDRSAVDAVGAMKAGMPCVVMSLNFLSKRSGFSGARQSPGHYWTSNSLAEIVRAITKSV